MVRVLACWLVLASTPALAQRDAPPEPVLPPPPPARFLPPPLAPPSYRSIVRAHRPSPDWTQDRTFTSTRFWLLDPGSFELQTWFRARIFPEVNGVRAPAELLLQQEIEIGLWPHVQIDLYENVTFNDENGRRTIQQEGNQLEARIAIPSYYGQMFANPVLYVEWHPRHNRPDRAELRLLLGGAPRPWLYVAVNAYVETNVEPTEVVSTALDVRTNREVVVRSSRFLADLEFGATLGAGVRVSDGFRATAELKIGADMLGDENNHPHFVWFLGPGFIWKPLPPRARRYLKIMGTCLFAMPGTAAGAQAFEPLVIVGSEL